MLLRRFGAPAVLLVVVGCSLTTSLDGLSGGPDDTDGASPEGGDVDALVGDGGATDAPEESLFKDVVTDVVDGCSLAGCFDMPAGFGLVAFGATAKGVACPTGFAAPNDTIENPSVAAGGCACGTCTTTTQPTCAAGTIVGHFDTAGSGLCDSVGGNLVNAGCGTDGFLGPFTTGNEHRYTPPAASGGVCNTPVNKDVGKLTFGAQGRFCQATTIPECQSKTCLPSVTAPFGACIGSTGDVACPPTFPNKHLLGSGATFTCSSGCTCSVSAACKGHLDFFDNGLCTAPASFTVPVDDTCVPTDTDGGTYLSHVYVANAPTGVACNKGGSTAPSKPAITQSSTICCN